MKKSFLTVLLLLPIISFSQSPKIVFDSKVRYLPRATCRYEYYLIQKDKVYHTVKQKSTNCSPINIKKKHKLNKSNVNDGVNFILNHITIDSLLLPLSDFNIDNISVDKLNKRNKVHNDALVVNFT